MFAFCLGQQGPQVHTVVLRVMNPLTKTGMGTEVVAHVLPIQWALSAAIQNRIVYAYQVSTVTIEAIVQHVRWDSLVQMVLCHAKHVLLVLIVLHQPHHLALIVL